MKELKEELGRIKEILEKEKGEVRTQIENLEKELRIAKDEVEREQTEKMRHVEEFTRVKGELEKACKVSLVLFPLSSGY